MIHGQHAVIFNMENGRRLEGKGMCTGNKVVNDFKNMDKSMLIKFQNKIFAPANKNKANYTQLEATQN